MTERTSPVGSPLFAVVTLRWACLAAVALRVVIMVSLCVLVRSCITVLTVVLANFLAEVRSCGKQTAGGRADFVPGIFWRAYMLVTNLLQIAEAQVRMFLSSLRFEREHG